MCKIEEREIEIEKVYVALTISSRKFEKTEKNGEKQRMNGLIKLIYRL